MHLLGVLTIFSRVSLRRRKVRKKLLRSSSPGKALLPAEWGVAHHQAEPPSPPPAPPPPPGEMPTQAQPSGHSPPRRTRPALLDATEQWGALPPSYVGQTLWAREAGSGSPWPRSRGSARQSPSYPPQEEVAQAGSRGRTPSPRLRRAGGLGTPGNSSLLPAPLSPPWAPAHHLLP